MNWFVLKQFCSRFYIATSFDGKGASPRTKGNGRRCFQTPTICTWIIFSHLLANVDISLVVYRKSLRVTRIKKWTSRNRIPGVLYGVEFEKFSIQCRTSTDTRLIIHNETCSTVVIHWIACFLRPGIRGWIIFPPIFIGNINSGTIDVSES